MKGQKQDCWGELFCKCFKLSYILYYATFNHTRITNDQIPLCTVRIGLKNKKNESTHSTALPPPHPTPLLKKPTIIILTEKKYFQNKQRTNTEHKKYQETDKCKKLIILHPQLQSTNHCYIKQCLIHKHWLFRKKTDEDGLKFLALFYTVLCSYSIPRIWI